MSLVVLKGKGARTLAKAAPVVVSTTSGNGKGKRRARKKSSTQGAGTSSPASDMMRLTRDYFNSLVDPFNNSGTKLGWGCLVNSTITTLYLRASTTANADGTVALAVYPNAKGLVTVANGGQAVSFATSASKQDATDQAAISANFSMGRVISMGLRAFPNLAATSAPGQIGVGAIPGSNFSLFEALTPADLLAFPTSRTGPAIAGGVATGRPQDVDSFNFQTQVVAGTGYAGTTDFPFSIPYIAMTGVGNATIVWFEAVVNIECIQILQHSSVGIGTQPTTKTLSDYWASVEKMYGYIRNFLPSPSTIGTVIGAAAPAVLDYLSPQGTAKKTAAFNYGQPVTGFRFGVV